MIQNVGFHDNKLHCQLFSRLILKFTINNSNNFEIHNNSKNVSSYFCRNKILSLRSHTLTNT